MSAACQRCGAALPPDGRFCASCGLGIDAAFDASQTLADDRLAAPRVSLATPDVVLPILRDATRAEYDVHRLVGTGGMSYVFEATELALQRKVAIKVMVPGLVPDPALRERFKREARTAASLTHPAIIPIHAVRESDQLVFFVMKFVEGRTLETILAMQGALPTPLAQSVVAQVAAGLAYAHRRGIVHRDVKPANILIDEHGFAVVTDFGIAKVDDAKRLTGTGSILGTPHYMAPEQFAGQNVGPASDQYALGALAYECLVGAPPFTGGTIAEVMKGHLFDEPVPVRTRRPDCPTAVADVVMRMLAKSPAQRFASLEDVGQRLGSGAAAADAPLREALGALARASDPLAGRRNATPQVTAVFDGAVPDTIARPARHARPAGARWMALVGALVVLVVAALTLRTPRATGTGGAPASETATTMGPATAAMGAPLLAGMPAASPPTVRPTPTTAAPARPISAGGTATGSPRRAARVAPVPTSTAAEVVASEPLARPQGERPAPAASEGFGDGTAVVRVGSRAAGTALFVNGGSRGMVTGVATVSVPAGSVRILLRVTGCAVEFDTTVVVQARDTLNLGTRMRECGP